jgi:hypothetical protein
VAFEKVPSLPSESHMACTHMDSSSSSQISSCQAWRASGGAAVKEGLTLWAGCARRWWGNDRGGAAGRMCGATPGRRDQCPAEPHARRTTSCAPLRGPNRGGGVEERFPPLSSARPSSPVPITCGELRPAVVNGVEGRRRHHRGAEHDGGEATQ